MRALSIRQPYVEEILRGIKTIEYRPKRVSEKLIGQRFYIYAALQPRKLTRGRITRPTPQQNLRSDSWLRNGTRFGMFRRKTEILMAIKQISATVDPEVAAMSAVINAIQGLEPDAQRRVISYAIQRFSLRLSLPDDERETRNDHRREEPDREPEPERREEHAAAEKEDGLEGINPVARKWMSRNGLTPDGLSKLFSLGIDEIDLVAQKVPGTSKKERMRSVILLKAVASYLGGGAARVTHEQVKEACLHYNAFDTDNFAGYLKKISAEVSGTKESGYTLTARGLTAATELIKQILNPPSK